MLSAYLLSITLLFPVKTWTMYTLDTLGAQSQEYRNIVRQAEQYITSPLPLITDKIKNFSGDRHNYESLSTYYWPPSPDTPTAPWVYRDGQKNPERLQYDGDKINKFSSRMLTLAKAYYLTDNQRYLDCCLSGLNAWFADKSTKMNPHLQYAQIVVNHNNNQGNYYGIIDAYVFIDVVESIRIIDYKGQMPKRLEKKVRKWFRQLSQWMLTSPQGISQSQAANNLSLAYDVMLYTFLTYTGQTDKAETLINSFQTNRIVTQFMPDGSQPQELKRAKPIAYSLYNLEHLLDMSLAARVQGNETFYPHTAKPVAHIALRYIQTLVRQLTQQPTIETQDIKTLEHTIHRVENKLDYLDNHPL